MTSTETAIPTPAPANKRAPLDNDDRPRSQNPANVAFNAKIAVIDARIADIRARMDATRHGYSLQGGENLSEKNRKVRGELIDKVKRLREEQKKLEDERRALFGQFNETLEQLKKKNADMTAAKDKLSFKNTAEIDRRVAEIEAQLDGGRFTLSEERQMLQEVSKLRKMRKALETLDGSGSDTASLRLRLDQVKLRQGDSDAALAAKKEEIAAVSRQLDELEGVRVAENAKRADSRTEMDKLRQELDAEHAKKNAAYNEFREAKAAKQTAYLRMVARREEQARQEAIETEIDKIERAMGKLSTESVVDKKWNECTILLNFFLPFSPSTLNGGSAPTVAKSLAVDETKLRKPRAMDLSTVQVIRKRDQDDEECYFKPAKTAQKHKGSRAAETGTTNVATSAAPDLSRLPFHILAALTDMALPIPKNIDSDVPNLLKTLESRRSELQDHRDASIAEVDARRNALLQEIEVLRAKMESKDEQITAATIKKMEKEAAAAEDAEAAEDTANKTVSGDDAEN